MQVLEIPYCLEWINLSALLFSCLLILSYFLSQNISYWILLSISYIYFNIIIRDCFIINSEFNSFNENNRELSNRREWKPI